MMTVLDECCYLPVLSVQQLPEPSDEGCLEDQLEIFSILALNKKLTRAECHLAHIDALMGPEQTFYTCRAVRRLLLGLVHVPCVSVAPMPGEVRLPRGSPFCGKGLVFNGNQYYTTDQLNTDMFVPGIRSTEETDPPLDKNFTWRMIYFPKLVSTRVSWTCMFQIISRYVNMYELDECVSLFCNSLHPHLRQTCTYNYSLLTYHLKNPSLQRWPQSSRVVGKTSEEFALVNFLLHWPSSSCLTELRTKVLKGVKFFPRTLQYLSALPVSKGVTVQTLGILKYVERIGLLFPQWAPTVLKRTPKKFLCVIAVLNTRTNSSIWLQFPESGSMLRIALCMAVAKHVRREREILSQSKQPLSVARALVANFQKMQYAPRDFPTSLSSLEIAPTTPIRDQPANDIKDSFNAITHISINGFKVNVFNTNMVINTNITCLQTPCCYSQIVNVPKLVNNFVIKKYSVKEPAFTASIFYSEDFNLKAAINVNISGDIINFLLAMNTLKCFLPVTDIFPASMANWNSTFDIHGLENQHLVRSGRRDVFWTTNFPSVVSSSEGYNVSWFKAATATVSKIHGDSLTKQVQGEIKRLISHRNARISFCKNRLFATLENRNCAQIQAAHKRFLECLYESCSWFRVNTDAVIKLAQCGAFDFSKRIIAHSKSRHECALCGYKVCNSIPKVIINHKKTRLDDCGRNANFISYLQRGAPHMINTKARLFRHICRRASLRSYHFIGCGKAKEWSTALKLARQMQS
ncbi:orf24 [Alcelaphine gammaherpesvirus 2]|uniref:Orf24 n=1 Tax=Alcelaphine gammaherpesvirus 2 TaxID=138184 RepID=A0A068AAK1_9GAMA|nr:orf24 [Alcelaphine gammaherpesvirus 2]AIA62061.1 orf24 [Alcelaphine gammaherpesvirus 2]